ncbi:MAG TPA: MlaD family protein [Bacillota bacterium]|nr:MlaD family protein [Bacillota bacterium]
MHMVSTETKVGLFAITAIIAMVSLFMWLNSTELFKSGPEMEAAFERIEGLRPGAPVKYAGVDVGRVTRIYFDRQSVIVVFRMNTKVELPQDIEAGIASTGVVGDKHLELRPATREKRPDNRIPGKSPASMEELYTSAAEILESVKHLTASLNTLLGDKEVATSLKNTIIRIDRLTMALERVAAQSEPKIHELLNNINLASSRLAEAGLTANRLLSQIDNNGQTAADIREALAHIKSVSANLDRFSKFLADNDSKIELLMDDAHRTMESINQAAQTIDEAVKEFSNNNDLSQLQQTLTQAGEAAQKVDEYVKKLESIKISQGIGAGYQRKKQIGVDYSLQVKFNEKNSLLFAFEDIGDQNLGSVQMTTVLPNGSYQGRAGLFRNKFGLGLDYRPNSKWSLGLDAWNVDSPNVGLSTRWKPTDQWSLQLSTETNLDTHKDSWSIEWWYHF